MSRWFSGLGVRRKVVLVAAAGVMTLWLEAFVGHVAGNPHVRWEQFIPLVYGAGAVVALAVAALLPEPRPALDRLVRVVGALGMAVGMAGTFFHGRAFVGNMAGETVTARHVLRALSLGPPLFAPGAFIGVGLLLVVMGRIIRD
jgi:hypothetical protein